MLQNDARESARNPSPRYKVHSQNRDILSVDRPFTALPSQTQNAYLSHEHLDVYQLALKFHVGVMDLLPTKGQRVLRDQLERASLSIVLNIAEGAGRCTPPERRRHFIIALGSAYECAAILDVLRLRRLASPE
jgi:four helix bundle protein